MSQRKLTDEELKNVMAARSGLRKMCPLEKTSKGHEWWVAVLAELDWMANYATTDGKPWVEPAPPIPEGYRLAVAGDEGRSDRRYWAESCDQWVPATCMAYRTDVVFIVPTDCTPTDEEASRLPLVMVREYDDRPWEKKVLVRVSNTGMFLCFAISLRHLEAWTYCRHLYPGE